MKFQKSRKNEHGFALLLALIISSVVLAIGISLLDVSINQLTLSSEARESEVAFQAAHAGADCMQYWRNEKATEYTSTAYPTPNPSVNCFGTTPVDSTDQSLAGDGAGNLVNGFYNRFQWGSPARCTFVAMYVMSAPNSDLTLQFANEGVGTNGSKTCLKGNTCTVIISDGFNRSCGELESGIFVIQRELTVEY